MAVIFKKEGIFLSEYNSNLKILEYKPIEEFIALYYEDSVTLDDGLLFIDIFNALEPHIDILEEHFVSSTGGFELKPYFDWIKQDGVDTELTSINFNWYTDSYVSKEYNGLEIYLHLNANGPKSEDGSIIDYSLSFIPLPNIKNLPVFIRDNCSLDIYDDGKKKTLFEFTKDTTLHDLIKCLLNEITFFGYPEDIIKQALEIKERVSSLEESINGVSFDDLKLQNLNHRLDIAVSEENYELASTIRDEINKLKNKEQI